VPPPLSWREATEHDCSLLQEFVCTNPAKRQYIPGRGKYHPREWELDAQSGIRDTRFPLDAGSTLLLGWDNEGLAVVCMYEYDDSDGYPDAFINVLAVALRAQGKGYGKLTMGYVLDLIEQRAVASGASEYFVTGHVHYKNARSQAMNRAHGLSQTEPADENGLETWSTKVAL